MSRLKDFARPYAIYRQCHGLSKLPAMRGWCQEGDAMPCPTGKSAMSFDLAAKARSRSSKSHDKAMGMYRCALCGDWHLGNPSRAKQPIKTIYSNHELRNL